MKEVRGTAELTDFDPQRGQMHHRNRGGESDQNDQVRAGDEQVYYYDKYSRLLTTFATGDSLLSCRSSAESGAAEETPECVFVGVCGRVVSVLCSGETPTEKWTRPGGI